jgi:hypothetical protein
MRSTQPNRTDALGMPLKRADASSCAKVSPLASLIFRIPSAPSDPLPDRIAPIALGPWSWARDSSSSSTGIGGPSTSLRGRGRMQAADTRITVLGGMT